MGQITPLNPSPFGPTVTPDMIEGAITQCPVTPDLIGGAITQCPVTPDLIGGPWLWLRWISGRGRV